MKTIVRKCFALLALALILSAYAFPDGGTDFKARCAPCHGSRGAGDSKLGQNLRVRDLSSAEVQKQSDPDLTAIISKGKGRMPAYEGKLSKDQIGDLVRFIRTLKK